MGAASINHTAITAFGAINTIIAVILTFLKGSGLPGRLKYFGDAWKKIREYIEQRERDFSRPNCDLDVHEVVATIEQMYSHTKHEIEMNTPDSYNSIKSTRAPSAGGPGVFHDKISHLDTSKVEAALGRLDGVLGHLKSRTAAETRAVQDSARLF